MRLKHLLALFVIATALTSDSCVSANVQPPVPAKGDAPPQPQQSRLGPTPAPTSPIRLIDFNNFRYPEVDSRGTFVLEGGREQTPDDPRGVVDVVYGDATGDGVEDAVVVQSQSTGGTAIPYFVYVYAANAARPRLLWPFYAGERGDGGLRRVSAAGGKMTVELYGRDRVVGGGTSAREDNIGVCCPKFYTRSSYEWRGGRFRLTEKETGLPTQGGAAYVRSPDGRDG